MEYNQFKQLLELKGIREKETISLLEDFIEKFPYSQTPRLLYAKALHDQNNIHYDRHLKLAAAYAPNREILRDLVETKTEEVEFEFPLPKKEELDFVSPGVEQMPAVSRKEEVRFEESYTEDEISGRAFEEQREKEKLVDPHEVIRQRLSEILKGGNQEPFPVDIGIKNQKTELTADPVHIENSTSKNVQEEKIIAKAEIKVEPVATINSDPEETVFTEEIQAEKKIEDQLYPVHDKSKDEKVIMAEAEKDMDVLDKMELEHAMEESILDSLEKLPSLPPSQSHSGRTQKEKLETPPVIGKVVENVSDTSSPRSFTEWLKTIHKHPLAGFEEVRAPKSKTIFSQPSAPEDIEQEQESLLSDDELIEKFLLEDPKIVPSKSEFYSPVSQAKKSVMDHDDVVSETLAQIYLQQGNTQKARWCYEKLILLHPEKSAFFAALLKEIPEGSDGSKN